MIRLVSPNPKAVSTNAHNVLPFGAQASIAKSRSCVSVMVVTYTIVMIAIVKQIHLYPQKSTYILRVQTRLNCINKMLEDISEMRRLLIDQIVDI